MRVDRKARLTILLAVCGTAVLALMIASTLVLAPRGIIVTRVGWLAYLAVASADLLPVAAVGCAMLVGAALRARSHRLLIAGGAAFTLGSSGAGMLTSPAISTTGWSFGATMVVLFWAGAAVTTVGGALLVVSLARRREQGWAAKVA